MDALASLPTLNGFDLLMAICTVAATVLSGWAVKLARSAIEASKSNEARLLRLSAQDALVRAKNSAMDFLETWHSNEQKWNKQRAQFVFSTMQQPTCPEEKTNANIWRTHRQCLEKLNVGEQALPTMTTDDLENSIIEFGSISNRLRELSQQLVEPNVQSRYL